MKREVSPQDQSTIKFNNTRMTLDLIRQEPGVSRSDVARRTGMSPTSITRIVAELQELGLVHETDAVSKGVGRKAVQLDINRDLFYVVGVDLSEKEFTVCLQKMGGEMVGKIAERPELENISGAEAAKVLHRLYRRLLKECKVDDARIAVVGVGAVGTVDVKSGVIVYADLYNWHNVDMGTMLRKLFKKPVFIDNDVKCALVGEIKAAGDDAANTVLLSFGRGVGGAIYQNGEVLRGAANSAGEIGHTIIDYSDGRLCICGRRGCVAAYLTEQRILDQVREFRPGVKEVRDLMTAYQKNEPWAPPLVERICNYISIAISNTVCFVNPPSIILGGRLLNDNPFVYDLAIDKYNNMRYEHQRSTLFKPSVLKQDATCRGGAYMATERYIDMLLQNGNGNREKIAFFRQIG